jgi:hypothetical protein
MPVISGGVVQQPTKDLSETILFTETTGAGTYTGSVTVPANSLIIDIKVWSTAVWTATTTALMDVGDAADPNGWYAAIDLKATDLVVGEQIRFESAGGKEGAYYVAATGELETAWSASERVISGIVVTVGAAGNAGRTYMRVTYSDPANIGAATKVAT